MEDHVVGYSNEDVNYGRKIGNGSFGIVFEGTLEGQRIAIKVPKDEMKLRDDVMNELKLLAKLKHPNVVKFLGILREDSGINLLFEFLDGDARTFVGSEDRSVETLLGFSHDIAEGMDYIHAMNIIHRDLAARNVLVDKNVAKISDFGLSRLVDKNHEHYTIKDGTMIPNCRWLPHECLQIGGIFSKSSDIWSFGVTLWEIWNKGGIPYGEYMSKEQVKQAISEGLNPMSFEVPEGKPAGGIKGLLDDIFVEEDLRPSFANTIKIQILLGINTLLENIFVEEHLRPSFANIKIFLDDIKKGNGNLTEKLWGRQNQKEGQCSNSNRNEKYFSAKSRNFPEEGASALSPMMSEMEITDSKFELNGDVEFPKVKNVEILSSFNENNTVKDLLCRDISTKKLEEIIRKFKVVENFTFLHNGWSNGVCKPFNSSLGDGFEDCIFKLPQLNGYKNLKQLSISYLQIDIGDVNIGPLNLPSLYILSINACKIGGDVIVDSILPGLFGLKIIQLCGNIPFLEKKDLESLLKINSLQYIKLQKWEGFLAINGSFAPIGPDGKSFDKITQDDEIILFNRVSNVLPWKMTVNPNE